MAFISIQNLQGEVYSCGATLITPSVLLTAAHCIDDTPTNPVTTILVKLGVTNVQTSAGEVWQATDWFAHPAYNSTTYLNDIACIVIGGLSSYAPVTLDWGSRATDVGSAVVAIGFGQTLPDSQDYYYYDDYDYHNPSSPTLQRVKEGILDMGWCASRSIPVSGSYQLCAGDLSGGRGTCYGDSGGPILSTVSDASNDWRTGVQVGIVSYGRGCGRVYGPGVYTRVSAYIPWLLRVVPLLPRPDTAVAAPALLQPHIGSAVCGAARIGWPLLIDWCSQDWKYYCSDLVQDQRVFMLLTCRRHLPR
jgi:secreted trypsin-like serine protease